jgi:hypothetical protein
MLKIRDGLYRKLSMQKMLRREPAHIGELHSFVFGVLLTALYNAALRRLMERAPTLLV